MTNFVVIYPADFFNPKLVDESFQAEAQHLKSLGFKISTVTDEFVIRPTPDQSDDSDIEYLYRGWMLTPTQYDKLFDATGHRLMVYPTMYRDNHYINGWLSSLVLQKLTPNTALVFETDVAKVIDFYSRCGFGKVFVKDFVKSLKTSPGPIVENANQLATCLEAMIHYRGHIEQGIAFREFVQIKPDSEKRVFVANGKIFGRLPFEYQSTADAAVTALNKAASGFKRIFYSLDFAKDIDENVFVVEIGDAQVSDFEADHLSTGVSLEEFGNALLELQAM